MREKIGVYICHCGGNISDYVDVERVRDSVADITFWSIGAFFMSAPGFLTVFLSILLLAGVYKRFKAGRRD